MGSSATPDPPPSAHVLVLSIGGLYPASMATLSSTVSSTLGGVGTSVSVLPHPSRRPDTTGQVRISSRRPSRPRPVRYYSSTSCPPSSSPTRNASPCPSARSYAV